MNERRIIFKDELLLKEFKELNESKERSVILQSEIDALLDFDDTEPALQINVAKIYALFMRIRESVDAFERNSDVISSLTKNNFDQLKLIKRQIESLISIINKFRSPL